jgi:hypothetical protein
MEATAEVQTFFADYQRIANSLDVNALAACFTDASLGASPGFVACITDRTQLHAAVESLVAFYRGLSRGVQVTGLDEHPLGEFHTLVTVGWTATFPQAAEPIPFEVSYLLQRPTPDGTYRIVAFVSHEDEQSLMRAHGIAPT